MGRHSHLFLAALALSVACTPEENPDGDRIVHDDNTVIETETWSGEHLVTGVVTIVGDLTIDPCAEIYFDIGAGLVVYEGATLKAEGTLDCPIQFVSSNEDSPARGQWLGIEFQASEGLNLLQNVYLAHAGAAERPAIDLQRRANLSVVASVISQNQNDGIAVRRGANLEDFSDNEITANGGYGIVIPFSAIEQLDYGVYSPNDSEGIKVTGTELSQSASWNEYGVPFVFEEGLKVSGQGTELRLNTGTTLAFGPDSGLIVQTGAYLIAEGSTGAPVVFTSTQPEPVAGDWNQVFFDESADPTQSSFIHTRFEYGGGNGLGLLRLARDQQLNARDTTFTESASWGLLLDTDAEIGELFNPTFSQCLGGAVQLDPNEVGGLGDGVYTQTSGQISVRGGLISKDALWLDHDIPYVAEEGFALQATSGDFTLTLDKGARVELGDNANIRLLSGSSLVTEGSAAKPVEFAPSGDTNWGSIIFSAQAQADGHSFTHTNFEQGGQSAGTVALSPGTTVDFADSTFSGSTSCDVNLAGGTVNATNTPYQACSTLN